MDNLTFYISEIKEDEGEGLITSTAECNPLRVYTVNRKQMTYETTVVN